MQTKHKTLKNTMVQQNERKTQTDTKMTQYDYKKKNQLKK